MSDEMTDTVDALHVKGPDGIIRALDEHYDALETVKQNPYGAWLAIQNLSDRLSEVEAELDWWKADSGAAWDKCEERRGGDEVAKV